MQRPLLTQTGIIELKCTEVVANYLMGCCVRLAMRFAPIKAVTRKADVQTVHRHRLFGRQGGDSEPNGLRVYWAEGDASPVEVLPPLSPRKSGRDAASPNGW
jgi:hypothetical protein